MLLQLTGQITVHYSSSTVTNTHLRLFRPDQGPHTVPIVTVDRTDQDDPDDKTKPGFRNQLLKKKSPTFDKLKDPISDQKLSFSRPVFRPELQNPYPFSGLAFRQKLCHHYLDSVRKKKNSSDAFQIRIFLLPSYSFGIETINKFIRSHSTLENHTRFQTKTAQKLDPMGRHIPI